MTADDDRARHDDRARRRHRNERLAAAALVVALAAALVAFLAWNRRQEEDFRRDQRYIPKRAVITPEIELLRAYLRIDTTPGKEAAGARWIAALLERNGIRPLVIEAVPGRPNVYARIEGRRKDEGLLLLQHIDVVGADASTWKAPPFGGDVLLNELYGRGALDMKGIGLTHLLAFIDVARSGRQPERTIALMAVSDEEGGGREGMEPLLERHPELFAGIRYAIGEGGVTEVNAEKVTYFGIEIGHKGWVELAVRAPSLEAIRAARFALAGWHARRTPDRVLPEVRDFLTDIGAARYTLKYDLQHIDATIARGRFWRLPFPYRHLTQSVIWFAGDRRAGPGAESTVRMLLLPDEDPKERVAWFAAQVEPFGVTIASTSAEPRTPLSDSSTPLFALIASEAGARFKAPAGAMILHRQSNDSRYLRRRGIDAYGVQPFPVDVSQSRSMHGADERVRLDWFMEGVALMRQVVRRWAFAS